MSRRFDGWLEWLETIITALYSNAWQQIAVKYAEFMADYEKKRQKMWQQVEDGTLTEAEYQNWCNRQILSTKAYKLSLLGLTNILVNTDVAAMAIVSDNLPYIVAESFNFVESLGFAAADAAGMSVGTFEIYNVKSVQILLRDNPNLLPAVDIPVDFEFNKQKINNVITGSIINGDDIPTTAKKLQNVTGMDESAAVRNARTAMTAAENMGRSESYDDLKAKGLPVKMQWSAVKDARTRDSHLLLDGTYRNDNLGVFGYGIIAPPYLRYPADPLGRPEERYNCRCRAGIVFENSLVDHSNDDALYEQFMKEKHPEDYAAMQTSAREIRRRSEAEAAELRKAELWKRQTEGVTG